MLGKIYERLSDKTKAIENYRKFLDLWKDADPGLPEVEDARKRLEGLKGEQPPIDSPLSGCHSFSAERNRGK